jgi:hypothetical protein
MSRLNHLTLAVIAILVPTSAPAEQPSPETARMFPARVLAAHNALRMRVGVPPLTWDNELGAEAAKYAVQLAITGTFAHSSSASRTGTGENLWMGTRGAFTVEVMVGSWASEKSMFVAGIFPNVARDGDWHAIGHYTQMVWPTTSRVGCAIATNRSADYLVCRYWPAGNVYGTVLRLP